MTSKKHCCKNITDVIEYECHMHSMDEDCPDRFICYIPRSDSYGYNLDGKGTCRISFCPFCGSKLSENRTDEWLADLEELGFDQPFSQEIPEKYTTDQWWREKDG